MFGEGDSLEKGGDRLNANPIRLEVGPLGAKPFSFGEGDAIDANSIRLLKVGIL